MLRYWCGFLVPDMNPLEPWTEFRHNALEVSVGRAKLLAEEIMFRNPGITVSIEPIR